MSAPVDAPVQRIVDVELKNFRGWVGDKTSTVPICLDADVVIITAANGRGKSSLIEAVAWLLNGILVHDEPSNRSLGKDQPTEVALTARFLDGKERRVSSGDPPSLNMSPGSERKILSRATTFLQDRLEEQFEPNDGQHGLIDFLAPEPHWLSAYHQNIAKERENIDRILRQSNRTSVSSVDFARRRRDHAARLLNNAILELRPEIHPGAQDPTFRIDDLRNIILAFTGRSRVGATVGEWLNALESTLNQEGLYAQSLSKELAEAQTRLDVAQGNLEAHSRDWPGLELVISWSGQKGQSGASLEEVLNLVAGLAESGHQWSDQRALRAALQRLPEASRAMIPMPDEFLTGLEMEFRRIDRDASVRYRDHMSLWVRFWRARQSERDEFIDAVAIARRDIEKIRRRGILEAQGRAESLRDAQAILETEEARYAVDRVQEADVRLNRSLLNVLDAQRQLFGDMQVGRLAPKVRHGIERAMNAVMRHFVVAGLESSREAILVGGEGKSLDLRLADGRTLAGHMSTGQRAQVALAWLLGTNALLQENLPHNILLLDDISTALDLTNIAAECALLRKFAYTKHKKRRRQVIIASHHDQLTQRMLALLLPPEGYELREVELLDWSLETGPVRIESTVEIMGKADDAARERLGKRLDGVFSYSAAERRSA